ncbi:RHS repeat domain-containing protein [Variovorax sp. WS11]|uniref:RHS repeat domain-containing protein n=1 Tax=Variovorax sp. WS11 TaxID=1105204 RepID=UPI0013DBBEF0|nr:RHS repeat-associated core domain-containing protein [Variovorax sp. WS11]NDZ17812.1 hypothetical protein [Variovorax sp. WS11]
MFKTEPLYPPAQGDENDPGFWQSLVAFFTQLWNPAANSAEQLGFSYVYDEEGTLFAEVGTGGANSGGVTQHIWLPTVNGPLPVATVIDGILYAVQADHLNTPRRITAADGQVLWQWRYSSFGDEQPTTAANRFTSATTTPSTGTTGASIVTYNLRYPGQYADKESGLFYNYFRSYSPTTGRYSQPDPIGLEGGWNRFGYVEANPLSFVDPEGLQRTWPRPNNSVPLGTPGSGQSAPKPLDPTDPLGPSYMPGPSAAIPSWLRGWLTPSSALDQCEADCDADYDVEQQKCEAWWKTTGRDPGAYRLCISNARRTHIQCIQNCKDCS